MEWRITALDSTVHEAEVDESGATSGISVIEVRRLLDLGRILLDVLTPDELEYLESVCGRPMHPIRAVPPKILLSENR
jgi:hypothetical protein